MKKYKFVDEKNKKIVLKGYMVMFFCFLILNTLLFSGFCSAEHQLPSDLVTEDSGLLQGLGDWANNVTWGWFWMFLLLGFCIVMVMSTVRYGMGRAFGFGGMVGMFGAMFLMLIGWMVWWVGSIFIVVGCVGVIVMMKSR